MVLCLQKVELLLDPVAVFRHREFQLPWLRRWPLLRETSQVSNNQCIPTSAAIRKSQIYRTHKTYRPSLFACYKVKRKLRYSCTHSHCSSVDNYTARSLYPQRGNPRYPLNEYGLAPEPVWTVLGKVKIYCLCRKSNPGPFSP